MIALIDIDGTVADNYWAHEMAYREVLGDPDFVLGARFGRPTSAVIKNNELARAKSAAYRRIVSTYGLKPIEGAIAGLTALRQAGFQTAIWSSASPVSLSATLTALRINHLFTRQVQGSEGKVSAALNLRRCDQMVAIDDDPKNLIDLRKAGWITLLTGDGAWRTILNS